MLKIRPVMSLASFSQRRRQKNQTAGRGARSQLQLDKSRRNQKEGNMSTEDVAMRLVELCKETGWKKAVDELYANDIVSVEPREVAGMPAEMRGIDKVRGKND